MKKSFKIAVVMMVLGTMLLFTAACSDGEATVSSGNSSGKKSGQESNSGVQVNGKNASDLKNLSAGQTVSKDGLSVSVDKITDGGKTYDGKKLLKVTVSYKNNGKESESFNPFDWSIQDKDGARSDVEFTGKSEEMSSGELAPGGTKTGAIYFLKKNADKIVYTGDLFFDGEEDLIMWNVK